MSLIGLILVLVIIGVILYLINTLPIAPPFKTLINVIVIIFVCLWLLECIGLIHSSGGLLRFPKL